MDPLVTLLVLFNVLLLIFVICLVLDYFFEKTIDIKDAHVLITGGSSGIGKEVAREALKLGAKVTIVARDVKKLDLAVNDLKNTSSKVAMLSLDVSNADNSSEEIRRKLQESIENFGSVKVSCQILTGCIIKFCHLHFPFTPSFLRERNSW